MGIFDWLFGGKKTTPISVKKETETSNLELLFLLIESFFSTTFLLIRIN